MANLMPLDDDSVEELVRMSPAVQAAERGHAAGYIEGFEAGWRAALAAAKDVVGKLEQVPDHPPQ